MVKESNQQPKEWGSFVADSGPLRFIMQADGRLRVLGVWTLKVQEGFPLDCSCQACRERDMDIDWVEVIADAINRGEFISLEKEVKILIEGNEGYLTDLSLIHI